MSAATDSILDYLQWEMRDDPDCAKRDLEDIVSTCGFDEETAATALALLVAEGKIIEDDGLYWADGARVAFAEELDSIAECAELRTKLATAEQSLAALREAIESEFTLAENARITGVYESRDEADRWRAEGDSYGWNFHQGVAGGMTEASFHYMRVKRKLLDVLK